MDTTDPETDAVDAVTDEDRDLYDIATWEERTLLDSVAVALYRGIVVGARAITILAALAILAVLVTLGGLGAVYENPYVGVLTLVSAVPAFGLAAYVWWADSTTSEPLWTLVATFLLGVLFAGFAAVVNTIAEPYVTALPLGMALFFFFIVGPVEETVKWLAVRLHAYRQERFDAVIDGAVYGAFAGLGFATIENALYVSRGFETATAAGGENVFAMVAGTAAVRAFAGPGHVIYSAFAGYYLGLAKFNEDDWGPIVVKGLLIAALVHASYNTLSGTVTGALVEAGLSRPLAVFGFIVAFDAIFGYVLVRKINRYRRAFEGAVPDGKDPNAVASEERGTDEGGANGEGGESDGEIASEGNGADEMGEASSEDERDEMAETDDTDNEDSADADEPDATPESKEDTGERDGML